MGSPHYVGVCGSVHLPRDLDPRDGCLRGSRRGADYAFTPNTVPESHPDCGSRNRARHAWPGRMVHRRPDFRKKTYYDLGPADASAKSEYALSKNISKK